VARTSNYFDGSRNIDYGHVSNTYLFKRKRGTDFSGHMRVQDITTDSGPRFQACDAYDMGNIFVSSENLVGNLQVGRNSTPNSPPSLILAFCS